MLGTQPIGADPATEPLRAHLVVAVGKLGSAAKRLEQDVRFDERGGHRIVAALAELAGDVTIVVNNAGENRRGPIAQAAIADMQAIFETNVFGVVRIAQLFAPVLANNGGGAIVNIHSALSWAAGAGASEVLVDDISRQLKAALSGPVEGLAFSIVNGQAVLADVHAHIN